MPQLDDRDTPLARISGLQPPASIVQIVIGLKQFWHESPQEIGDVDLHRAGWAVRLARHAVPALVVGHIGLAGHLADAEHIERTDIDADRASLVGNAFCVVDDHRNGGLAAGEWHGFNPWLSSFDESAS